MEFNACRVKEQIVEWIRNWFEENGKGCCAVLGVSGGKDSSVVAALCAEALGKERVIGVLMPNGEQSDIDCAQLLVAHLGIRHYEVNIERAMDGLKAAMPLELSVQAVTNLPPRVRMATLYAVSQSCNGRVANTCNLSEDYVGYATLFGDAAGSFSVLGMMTVTEVLAIGDYLGLPSKWVHKTPDDGLPNSSPDEIKLGFTYAELDRYIREGIEPAPEKKEKIDRLNRINRFKTEILRLPVYMPEIGD